METIKLSHFKFLVVIIVAMLTTSCDQSRNKAKLGNSQDTSSVNRAGGQPITDTATVSKERRDSAANPKKSNTAKGNADPSGRIKNQ